MGKPILFLIRIEFDPRFQVLHIGNLIYLAFNLGCAFAPTAGSLIAFRFLGKTSPDI
jgi:hypothetical protein